MALTRTQTFETGVPDGTAMTIANSGGDAGMLWDGVVVDDTALAAFTSMANSGSLSAAFTGTADAAAYATWSTALEGGYRSLQGQFTIALPTPPDKSVQVCAFSASGPKAACLCLNNSGRLTVCDSAGRAVATSAGTLPPTPGSVWLIRFDLTFGTRGCGSIHIRYSPANPTPDEVLTFAGVDFYGLVDQVRFGVCRPAAATVRIDDVIVTDQGMPGGS